MAVVSVTELKDRDGEADEDFKFRYTRTFQVITNNPWDGPIIAMNAPGIAWGSIYSTSTETNLTAYATNFNANCVSEDGKTWHVKISYGPAPAPEREPNPLSRPLEVSWSFQQFERPTDRDINGQAIVNSCGDPFQEAIMRDDSRPVLSVTRNESSFNAGLASIFRDSVNSTTFQGSPPGTVKVSNISSKLMHDQTYGSYWQTSYEFHFNADGWDKVILDQGFREISNGKKKPITVQGLPVSEPHLLNGQGRKLPEGAYPVWGTFRIYPRLPFTVFGF